MASLVESLLEREQEGVSRDELRFRARQSRENLTFAYRKLKQENSELLLAPQGTDLQKAIQIVSLANIYGQSAGAYLEKGKPVYLTAVSQLSLTDARFEAGSRKIASNGQLDTKLGIWFIHNDYAREASSDLLKEMTEGSRYSKMVNKLAHLSPDQLLMTFINHLDRASR